MSCQCKLLNLDDEIYITFTTDLMMNAKCLLKDKDMLTGLLICKPGWYANI